MKCEFCREKEATHVVQLSKIGTTVMEKGVESVDSCVGVESWTLCQKCAESAWKEVDPDWLTEEEKEERKSQCEPDPDRFHDDIVNVHKLFKYVYVNKTIEKNV